MRAAWPFANALALALPRCCLLYNFVGVGIENKTVYDRTFRAAFANVQRGEVLLRFAEANSLQFEQQHEIRKHSKAQPGSVQMIIFFSSRPPSGASFYIQYIV
jgi:hypothetical protein